MSIATRSITMIACAAFVASLAAALMATGPAAKAAPLSDLAVIAAYPKGDRLPLRATGAACSSSEWPRYEQRCQFDYRRPADEARPIIRVIGLR